MKQQEVRERLVAAKTSIEDAMMYLTAIQKDPEAMCNLTGHSSIQMMLMELGDQREAIISNFNIGEREHGYL